MNENNGHREGLSNAGGTFGKRARRALYIARSHGHSASMTFHIRTASLADVPAMHEVRMAVRENRLSGRNLITEASYVRFIDTGSAWVAVNSSQKILGFGAIDQATESVWALFVDVDQEGVGIGRSLHDIMMIWAREHGIRELWLVTAPGTRAEQFYLSAGWKKNGASGTLETRFVIGLGS